MLRTLFRSNGKLKEIKDKSARQIVTCVHLSQGEYVNRINANRFSQRTAGKEIRLDGLIQ